MGRLAVGSCSGGAEGGVRCGRAGSGNYPVSLVMISWPPACAAAAASTPAL